MFRIFIALLAATLLVAGLASCEDAEGHSASDGDDDDDDGDGGPDADADGDGDSDADTDPPSGTGSLQGTVMAPSGAFPIPGALVYLTSTSGSDIEDSVFCYDCEDMTGKKWTLSGADGTWSLEDVAAGDWNLVTRKGFFQRQRPIVISGDPSQDVPVELTTLPADNSSDGLDQIPNYAVLLNSWDRIHDLLAKLGMGEVGGDGALIYGTETFQIFNDDVSYGSYPYSNTLFTDQATLDSYHQTFFPCTSAWNSVSFVHGVAPMLRSYVDAGGKVYNSCCTALWTDYAFPEYIDFYDSGSSAVDPTNVRDVGRISSTAYSTTGNVVDPDLAAWLSVVTTENPAAFPFTDGYVKIDNLVNVDDGMGLEENDGWVLPYAWVEDTQAHPGSPLMVTYNWGCGKIFYSVYETSQQALAAVTPQEYVLLYLILEVGVCEGDYIPPE